MLLTALKQTYFLEGPFLCCIRVNPYTVCGYVRLYAAHPFNQRTEQDKEVHRLSPPITFGADDLDGEGWWLGFYHQLCTPQQATVAEVDRVREGVRQLTMELRPRRHSYIEYAAWYGEAIHAIQLRVRSRTSHALPIQR